jgi:hypothetical protein
MSTETEPNLAEAPPAWPPVQHIVHKDDLPVKEGDIALCGEKLMGLYLGMLPEGRGPVCGKCLEAARKLAEAGGF